MTPCVFDLTALRDLAGRTLGSSEFHTVPMPGGMSPRRFVRVQLPSGSSAVGMFFPDGAGSDEVNEDGSPGEWPFIEVQKLLHGAGVRVPALLGEAKETGWLLVEDFGDMTLARYLQAHPERREELYTTAIEDLVDARRRLTPVVGDTVVGRRSFDRALLEWEVDHFREWALQARGIDLSTRQLERYQALTNQLVDRITASAYGFVHRDYQSRNLMVLKDEPHLGWVDFQDALQGPRVYDLVALLGDSYQSFSPAFVRARIEQFCDLSGFSTAEVLTEFSLVSIQRKLKDAGRFVYIDRVRGDASYLKFVAPTIMKVRRAVAALGPDDPLAALDALLTELGV